MRIAALLLILCSVAHGAEAFSPLGEWTVASVTSLVKGDPANSGSLTMEPGGFLITITTDHIHSLMYWGDTKNETDGHYDIVEKAEDHWVIVVHDTINSKGEAGKTNDSRMTIKADGHHLIVIDGDSRSVCDPWTADLQRQFQARLEDLKQPAPPIEKGPVKGVLNGKPWTSTHTIRSSFQEGPDELHCKILSSELSDENGIEQTAILLAFPLKPGHYPLGNHRNITFYTPPGSNAAAIVGEIVVEVVDDEHVEFSITARLDKNNVMSGHSYVLRR
jgi:hypothetical protein